MTRGAVRRDIRLGSVTGTLPCVSCARRPLLAALLALAAGCGGASDAPDDLPPPAGAAASPPPQERPAGRVVDVGEQPVAVAADPSTGLVAVATRNPPQVVLLDGETLEVRRRVSLPAPARTVRIPEPGRRLLAPLDGDDRIAELELPDGDVRLATAGAGPRDADALGDRVFVADELGNTLTVLVDGRRVAQVPAPLQPASLTAVPGGPIAVLAVRERRIRLYDPETAERLDDNPAGVGPTAVVAGGGGRLYVPDPVAGAVLLFRTRPHLQLVRRYGLDGAPYAAAVDRERGKLWVTLPETNRVVQLTADGAPRSQQDLPTVRQPDAVAVHEPSGRVFVAGRHDGVLQSFEGYPDEGPPG
jgi:DNA-binding beta-propeller fold protein YncE